MLFHPQSRTEKEQRLIFVGGTPAAAPGEGAPGAPPSAELTPEQKQIQEQIDKVREGNPDAAKELADFQVQRAEEDNARLQERYRAALVNAANAYHQELLKVPGGDHLKTVNEAFAPAGVRFALGTDGKLAIGAETPTEAGQKGRELTDEEQTMIDEAFAQNPDLAAAAERLMAGMQEGGPELAVAQGFFEAFNAKSPKEKQAILTNDQAFQKFMKELPADQQKFVDQLRQTTVETGNELSDDERKDIVDGAAKELEKFDVTKASEIDKNIMLARMQMRGIDTSNPDAIFKKPPELKALEGSSTERGFSKIMGLIGFILLNIQKMKEMVNPAAKSGPAGSPEAGKPGAETATNASNAERRRNLVAEMTDSAKTGAELLANKENRLKDLNDAAGPSSIAALQRIAESRRPSATAPTATDLQKNELRDLDKRIGDLTQERDKLQADVTELTAMKREVETGKAEILQKLNSIQDLLNLRAIPGTDGLAAALGRLTMRSNDYFQLTADPDAGANKWAHVNTINNVMLTKLGRPPDQAISVDNLGVFQSPIVARDAMSALYQKLVEEARPAAAPPAAPAGPAAATPPAAR